MNLCSRTTVKELLQSHALSPRKSYGQNFLINSSVPQLIAEKSAELSDSSPKAVIEIGPGIGALTSYLSQYYDRVAAIEIDRGLAALLEETFSGIDNVEIICDDFMNINLKSFIDERFSDIVGSGGDISICANLPYYITTPVIMKILDSFTPSEPIPLKSVTIMIQLEVANRLCASPGSQDYGSITASLGLQVYSNKLFNVSANNFYPVPNVSSAVVRLEPHGGICETFSSAPSDKNECEEFFHEVKDNIAIAFGQRRKTLVNALSSKFCKDAIKSAITEMGLREDVRGEKLSSKEFCDLTYKLKRLSD